jgi:hypothetical protein
MGISDGRTVRVRHALEQLGILAGWPEQEGADCGDGICGRGVRICGLLRIHESVFIRRRIILAPSSHVLHWRIDQSNFHLNLLQHFTPITLLLTDTQLTIAQVTKNNNAGSL